MFSESPPLIRRVLRFLALPYCYARLVDWNECKRSHFQVFFDFLFIFFKYKYYPDNYGPCRFWEKNRDQWAYFYGSTYNSYSRYKLRKEIQPYEYRILFDDKYICSKLLEGTGIPVPTTYCILTPQDDSRSEIEKIINSNDCDKLILKPILGHAGIGIQMVDKRKDGCFVLTKDKEERLERYKLREPVIVQEVLKQNQDTARIAPNSLNTIRVVTLLTKEKRVVVISSTMRFGVGASFIDNWSAGGVAVGVDHDTGRLKKIGYDKVGRQYEKHPETEFVFFGYQIPYWQEVLAIAVKVQKVFDFYKLIGVDIGLTEEGPVLVEVNANSDIIFQEQTSGPLLKDRRVLLEFEKYDLLVNKYQKRLLRE